MYPEDEKIGRINIAKQIPTKKIYLFNAIPIKLPEFFLEDILKIKKNYGEAPKTDKTILNKGRTVRSSNYTAEPE